ncbi:MAG: arylsulfatase [Halioglobus sp.]
MMKCISSSVFFVSALACSSALNAGDSAEKASPSSSKAEKPNILLIVADDLGFSDLGAFGGEIETPNLDALATSGVRLTSFYASPTCSPTRSMLLTGLDNHQAGVGAMAEALPSLKILQGKTGYEGYLNPETTTISEALSDAGYRTFMTGKWHLGSKPEQQPTAHGFDRAFVLSQGGADHFGAGQNGGPALQPATYTEDGRLAQYPVGAYSSDFFAQRLVDYLSEKDESGRPFFAYLAFTAPHWPLQAPAALIAKYQGRYDAGPAALRSARLQKMTELQLLSEASLSANLVGLDDWAALSDEQRKIQARNMEIYAAMVDSIDQNVGRVLDHLRATGEFDNTVVIFMSDNGAEGIEPGALINRTAKSTPKEHKAAVLANIKSGNADLTKMGTTESFITYGSQWAQAGSAPFRRFKGEIEEGGVRVPAFVSGPGVKGRRIINSPLSVRDIMPTVLDLSNTPHYEGPRGEAARAADVSMTPTMSWKPMLDGSVDAVRSNTDAVAWEFHMKRGVRVGDWKAVYGKDASAQPGDRKAPSSWKLYNLSVDAGEGHDVSEENGDVLQRLVSIWDSYAEENGVFVPGPRK